MLSGHLAVVEAYQGHTVSLERQTSDCVIDGDQDTPLLQADEDEDDEVMLDIRPTVSQPSIVNIMPKVTFLIIY